LTHPFFVLVTVGLGHGVDRKLYTLFGGQRADKFENHWPKPCTVMIRKLLTPFSSNIYMLS